MARGIQEQAVWETASEYRSSREGNQTGSQLRAASKGATSPPYSLCRRAPPVNEWGPATNQACTQYGAQVLAWGHKTSKWHSWNPALCRLTSHCWASRRSRWPLRTLTLILKEVEILRFGFWLLVFLILPQLWQLFPSFNTDFYSMCLCESIL